MLKKNSYASLFITLMANFRSIPAGAARRTLYISVYTRCKAKSAANMRIFYIANIENIVFTREICNLKKYKKGVDKRLYMCYTVYTETCTV